jgi:hypothetical protein
MSYIFSSASWYYFVAHSVFSFMLSMLFSAEDYFYYLRLVLLVYPTLIYSSMWWYLFLPLRSPIFCQSLGRTTSSNCLYSVLLIYLVWIYILCIVVSFLTSPVFCLVIGLRMTQWRWALTNGARWSKPQQRSKKKSSSSLLSQIHFP